MSSTNLLCLFTYRLFWPIKLCQASRKFWAIGYSVSSTQEFSEILELAKKSTSTPVIISVEVDYSRNPVLIDDDF